MKVNWVTPGDWWTCRAATEISVIDKEGAMHEKKVSIGRSESRKMGRNVRETREAYAQRREAELKELNARLYSLEAQAEHAEAEAKIGYGEQIYELKEKRRHARDKIEELKRAGGEAWKDLVDGIEEAVTDFRTALDVASTRFV
jgi:chromosome segregation ATPase